MTSFRMMLGVAVLAVQFVTVSLVHAEGMKGYEGKDKGEFAQKWREKKEQKIQDFYAQLGLTDEQKAQLQSNKEKSKADMKMIFEKKKELKDRLNQELMKSELNMESINNIQSQIKAAQAETSDHRLQSILEVRKILTAEQFSKFISLMESHKKDRFGSHKGE